MGSSSRTKDTMVTTHSPDGDTMLLTEVKRSKQCKTLHDLTQLKHLDLSQDRCEDCDGPIGWTIQPIAACPLDPFWCRCDWISSKSSVSHCLQKHTDQNSIKFFKSILCPPISSSLQGLFLMVVCSHEVRFFTHDCPSNPARVRNATFSRRF